MPGIMKNVLEYLGMEDVSTDDGENVEEVNDEQPSFDDDQNVTPLNIRGSEAGRTNESVSFPSKMNRITSIHPRSYEEAQLVGRAIRDGIPVILNLVDVPEDVAYRIVDFSAGVVFGLRGSIDRVTSRVFLLCPAQVNIYSQKTASHSSTHDLFAD